MGYRDNLNAIVARGNALERDLKDARAEIAQLRAKLEGRSPETAFGDEWPAVPEAHVTDEDCVLAETLLATALAYRDEEHDWEQPPVKPPRQEPPTSSADRIFEQGRELGREEGAVQALRFALHALLEHRTPESVPPSLIERIRGCTDAVELVEWITAVGIANDDEIDTFTDMVEDS